MVEHLPFSSLFFLSLTLISMRTPFPSFDLEKVAETDFFKRGVSPVVSPAYHSTTYYTRGHDGTVDGGFSFFLVVLGWGIPV